MTVKLDVKVRLRRGNEIAMGPGKADLLDAIIQTHSISGAARMMNMSYRHAWLLVEGMNRCFREPLVHRSAGGAKGGGAQVTEAGIAILHQYRRMQRAALDAAEADLQAIKGLFQPEST